MFKEYFALKELTRAQKAQKNQRLSGAKMLGPLKI